MKSVLIMFGGISPEHEVSIITGLQVLEHIDTTAYRPLVVYVDKKGMFFLLENAKGRSDFHASSRTPVSFGKDEKGGFIKKDGLIGGGKIYPYAAYLAFHGGTGEGGEMQGLLESVGIPFTSCGQEASVITMNKKLTKQVVASAGIDVVRGMNIFSSDIKEKMDAWAEKIIHELQLPAIVKPVHLGSSIGITIARTDVELKKALLESAFIDREILIEQYLSSITEYNCAVRMIGGVVEASEVERPFSRDQILSFADKYERGGKKSGGMARADRELPAKIDDRLRDQIKDVAKKAFVACGCKGMVRVDFMRDEKEKLYLTEINPIPGSMAFYLWEATGISFKKQISDLIEEGVSAAENEKSFRLDYKSDIVEKFIKQPKDQ